MSDLCIYWICFVDYLLCNLYVGWAFIKDDFEVEENGLKPLRLSSLLINWVRGCKSSLNTKVSDAAK